MAYTANQLGMLQVDLGLMTLTPEQETYLGNLLDTAQLRLARDGIRLDAGDAEHDALVVMYAAWLYRKRAQAPEQQAMPQMLRLLRNSVLFGQKARDGA